MRYWLLKTEPGCFSIDDLAKSPAQTTCWDGVRNYQARNFMRDQFKRGDGVLFYHSSADPPAIVGTAVVVRESYADASAWDPNNEHFDSAASPENPIWQMVDIRLEQIFAQPLSLEMLRAVPALANMELLRRGSRLSVQPVTAAEWQSVLSLARSGKESTPARPRAKRAAAPADKRKASPAPAAARGTARRPQAAASPDAQRKAARRKRPPGQSPSGQKNPRTKPR